MLDANIVAFIQSGQFDNARDAIKENPGVLNAFDDKTGENLLMIAVQHAYLNPRALTELVIAALNTKKFIFVSSFAVHRQQTAFDMAMTQPVEAKLIWFFIEYCLDKKDLKHAVYLMPSLLEKQKPECSSQSEPALKYEVWHHRYKKLIAYYNHLIAAGDYANAADYLPTINNDHVIDELLHTAATTYARQTEDKSIMQRIQAVRTPKLSQTTWSLFSIAEELDEEMAHDTLDEIKSSSYYAL